MKMGASDQAGVDEEEEEEEYGAVDGGGTQIDVDVASSTRSPLRCVLKTMPLPATTTSERSIESATA